MASNTLGLDLTRYLGRGGIGRIKANSSNVLQIANKCGGVAELAAGTYTIPTLESGQDFFYFWVNATGSVTITGAATMSSGDVALVVETSTGAWSSLLFQATGSSLSADDVSYTSNDTDASGVASALDVIFAALKSSDTQWVGVPLTAFREVDSSGDVGNAAAIGGVLASDTTPIFEADAAEAMDIRWAANDVDIIAAQVALPPNFDGTQDVTINLLVQASGTSNAPSFSILTNWDGGSQVTDTAAGSASAAKQTITATVAAADIADTAQFLSMQIVPGAHGTDAWSLYGVQVRCAGADINV